jgi:hypothetical protein
MISAGTRDTQATLREAKLHSNSSVYMADFKLVLAVRLLYQYSNHSVKKRLTLEGIL